MSSPVHTPESLGFSRSDSKNPAATCKGITGNGRHCRRALAVGGKSIRQGGNGDGPEYYCHQHKDQAQLGSVQVGRRKDDVIRERSSIETLVQRLGISEKKTKGAGRRDRRTEEKDFAQSEGDESQTSLPERRKESHPTPKKRPTKQPGFWASLCCAGTPRDDDDYVEIIRHRRRMDAQTRPSAQEYPTGTTLSRPTPDRRASSNTATNNLLALLPPHLSPEITSSLLSELVKPISPADEEGYIYIYWLTKTGPQEDTARNLLASSSKQTSSRRISEVLTSEQTRPGTIMLKIGRASNVTRRMKEWERQCGFKLNLVRWYPYAGHTSSPSASPGRGSEAHKVPFVKRVERLIHLELAGQQVRRQCAACGKEHREWFEVQATREGVKAVDAVVRRWVAWAEGRV